MESRMLIDRRNEGRMEKGEVEDDEDEEYEEEEDKEEVARGVEEVEMGVSKWLSSL